MVFIFFSPLTSHANEECLSLALLSLAIYYAPNPYLPLPRALARTLALTTMQFIYFQKIFLHYHHCRRRLFSASRRNEYACSVNTIQQQQQQQQHPSLYAVSCSRIKHQLFSLCFFRKNDQTHLFSATPNMGVNDLS
jgi:hypothetical protein